MNCRQAQSLLDELSRGRLDETTATAVRQHLDDCTDCRVTQQRIARLQRLLALKRYERPAPGYLEGFADEFHRRLAEELRPRPALWDRFIAGISLEPARGWRYGFAGALGVAMAAVVLWGIARPAESPLATAEAQLAVPTASPIAVAVSSSLSIPQSNALTLSGLPSSTDGEPVPMMAGNTAGFGTSVIELPAAASSQLLAPRYVLDRITVTPASYEVASVDF
jgi:anti-sigma factor RsiW